MDSERRPVYEYLENIGIGSTWIVSAMLFVHSVILATDSQEAWLQYLYESKTGLQHFVQYADMIIAHQNELGNDPHLIFFASAVFAALLNTAAVLRAQHTFEKFSE